MVRHESGDVSPVLRRALFVGSWLHQIHVDGFSFARAHAWMVRFLGVAVEIHFVTPFSRLHALVRMRNIECRPRRCSNPDDSFGFVLRHVGNILEFDVHLIRNIAHPVWQVHKLLTRRRQASVIDSGLILQVLKIFINLSLFLLEL